MVLDLTDCGGPWRTEWSELALVAGVTDRLQVAGEPPADAKRPKQVLDADAMPVLRRRSIFGLGGVPDEQTPGLPDHGSPQHSGRRRCCRTRRTGLGFQRHLFRRHAHDYLGA